MLLARIVGTVVATRKDPRLVSSKLMVARAVDPRGKPEGHYLVAVDTVDAGVGEKDPLSPSLRECLATKFYFDDIYDWVIRNIQGAATWILGLWDIWVVDLSVKLSALGVLVLGNLQTYVIYLGLALVALIYWGIIHHCPL